MLKNLTLITLLIGLLSSLLWAQSSELDSYLSSPGPSTPETRLGIREVLQKQPELTQSTRKRLGSKGEVPLLVYSIEEGDFPLTELLIELGADPNVTAGAGDRPALHWVFSSKGDDSTKAKLAKLLISQGAIPTTLDSAGRSVFHAYVESQPWDNYDALMSTSLLLSTTKAPLEQEDNKGITPLMAAVMRHDASTVRRLILLGANPSRKSEVLQVDARTLAEQQAHSLDTQVEAKAVLQVFEE